MTREYERPTKESCQLIDLEQSRPFPGQRVLGLSIGGVLTPTIWSESQADFYDAWCEYPRIPKSVKARQNARMLKALQENEQA